MWQGVQVFLAVLIGTLSFEPSQPSRAKFLVWRLFVPLFVPRNNQLGALHVTHGLGVVVLYITGSIVLGDYSFCEFCRLSDFNSRNFNRVTSPLNADLFVSSFFRKQQIPISLWMFNVRYACLSSFFVPQV
jgi:hypothetical protein